MKKETENNYTKAGDATMENYRKLDMNAVMSKKGKIISSEEALRDIVPIEWDEEVLNGERKVVLTKPK